MKIVSMKRVVTKQLSKRKNPCFPRPDGADSDGFRPVMCQRVQGLQLRLFDIASAKKFTAVEETSDRSQSSSQWEKRANMLYSDYSSRS